jgi:DNA-binding NtrC family response regulator
MSKEDLEEVIEKRKKVVETVMHKLLGVSIRELNNDLTSRLSYPFEYFIDTAIDYKKAKKLFIKSYIEKLLKKNLGNISEAAREAGINRRTIHRMIQELDIKIESIRSFLLKPEYIEMDHISKIIEGTLKKYDYIIHPNKLNEMYEKVYDASEDLVKSLPEKSLSLKDAEDEFEMMYFSKALKENKMDEKLTAKKIGIRYETLHRKMQKLKRKFSF